jgi:Uma2 family endonuclease
VEEYLAFEDSSPIRHEYVDGELFAFAGGAWGHHEIASNIHAVLRPAARALGCRAALADIRLAIESERIYYYPDVMVTCEPLNDSDRAATRPVVLVEVLSDSTQRIDREAKLMVYRNIESLRHYLIVHQRERLVEWHQRSEHDGWQRTQLHRDDSLAIDELGVTLSLAEIYAGTDVQ